MTQSVDGSSACPVCASQEVTPLIEIPASPVFCNQLCHTREEALEAPVAKIRLAFCESCGHLFNVDFDPGLLSYSPEYENSLHFSGQFQRYADGLAAELTDKYGLDGKTVIEIGCGRGDFLKALCRDGSNSGFGYDPSYPGVSGVADTQTGVTIYRESYTEFNAGESADLLACRHCLEHIGDPVEFLKSLRRAIGAESGTGVFFEVPNGLFTLRDGGIWDIIYEHCAYFTASSIRRAFERTGYSDIEIDEAFSGQFLTLNCASGGIESPPGETRPDLGDTRDFAVDFANTYREKVAAWDQFLHDAQTSSRKVVVWGAGSKGTTFLNVFRERGGIDYVVDINPRKLGKFVAGSGQEIVAAEFLRDYAPDTVVVMNAVYADEISATCEELGVDVEFKFA